MLQQTIFNLHIFKSLFWTAETWRSTRKFIYIKTYQQQESGSQQQESGSQQHGWEPATGVGASNRDQEASNRDQGANNRGGSQQQEWESATGMGASNRDGSQQQGWEPATGMRASNRDESQQQEWGASLIWPNYVTSMSNPWNIHDVEKFKGNKSTNVEGKRMYFFYFYNKSLYKKGLLKENI